MDSLAVFVHKDNPIQVPDTGAGSRMRFPRPAKVGAKDAMTWGDLGLKGEWADKPISLDGRNVGVRYLRLLQGSGPLRGD